MIDREKQNKRQNEWKRQNRERVALELPNGMKDQWKVKAQEEGLSLTEWIIKRVTGE